MSSEPRAPGTPCIRDDMVFKFGNYLREVINNHAETMTRTCMTCIAFDEPREICKRHPERGRPPAKIIAYGCPEYFNEDEIPF